MKISLLLALVVLPRIVPAQEPWKNIYSQHAWTQRDRWQKADALIGMLKINDGSEVADIGCHEGYMTFKLAKKVGTAGKVYAVDLDQSKLDKVKKRAQEQSLRQIVLIKGEENNPKLPSGLLDAVIILDTYHEMNDPVAILQHISASLKIGGRLLICEPIADARRKLSRAEQERKHELALPFAAGDLRKTGFKIVFEKDNFIDRTKEKGDRMWVIVAEKL